MVENGGYGGRGKTRREGGVADTEITEIGISHTRKAPFHKPPPENPGPKPPPFVEPTPLAPQKPPPQTPP